MTIPGWPEYAPATQRNVPKYLAPEETLDRLIAYPTAHKEREASINGKRSLTRSDHMANVMRMMASRTVRPITHNLREKGSLANKYGGTVSRLLTAEV